VRAYISPTLNFSGRKEGLRYAVSFDDAAPQIVDIASDTSTKAWDQLVADNVSITVSTHQLAHPGQHVLKFWLVDPGVVLQKLVVDAGGVKPSYLGPPESFRGPKSAVAIR
jgi:ABC-type cobalamin transport system ATPase subunit